MKDLDSPNKTFQVMGFEAYASAASPKMTYEKLCLRNMPFSNFVFDGCIKAYIIKKKKNK